MFSNQTDYYDGLVPLQMVISSSVSKRKPLSLIEPFLLLVVIVTCQQPECVQSECVLKDLCQESGFGDNKSTMTFVRL